MTKRMLSVLSAVTLVAMLAPLSVRIGAAEVNCLIPFSFSVNGRPMPAGSYSFETLGASGLIIKGANDRTVVMGTRTGSVGRTDPKLVFEKSGDHYTLREIWMGSNYGHELRPTHQELDRRAAATFQTERVVINAQ